MDMDTKRILAQVLETIMEQQRTITELSHKHDALIAAIAQSSPLEDYEDECEYAAAEAGSADGVGDRIARLSELVRHS